MEMEQAHYVSVIFTTCVIVDYFDFVGLGDLGFPGKRSRELEKTRFT